MSVQKLKGAQEFLEQSKDVLYQKEAEYGLMLGLAEMRAKNFQVEDKNIYLQIDGPSSVPGYAMATDKNIIISKMSETMIQDLVTYLHKNQTQVPGVVGPTLEAETFAKIYSQTYDVKYTIAMDQKIYQLTQVLPARPTEGRLVVAAQEHFDIGVDWFVKFVAEALPNEPATLEEAQKFITQKIKNQELFIWVNNSGQPVGLNMKSRPTQNGISISFVYTPQEERGKGYASALVAQTSQLMLDEGKKFCVLYTDITNPTSNGIYQKIGYNEIATSKNFIFLK